jgi:hypothetical protein
MSAPIFFGSLIYFVFPPTLGSAMYKTALILSGTLFLWVLAIRFKGRILLLWAITIGRYNLRPRYFVNDKNDLSLRESDLPGAAEIETKAGETEFEDETVPAPALSFSDTVFLERIMTDPKANLHFRADRKGELRVHINEER